MDTYTRRESEIVVVEEDVVDTPVVGIENIHGIKLEKPTMRLLGTTFVNLLGKYGNFEVDSNSDGLADGWTAVTYIDSKSLSADEVFGNYSQYVNYTHSAADDTVRVSTISKAFVVNEATYFFSQYMKKGATHTANKTHLYAWLSGSSVGRSKDVTSSLTTNFSRFSLKFTTDSSTTAMIIYPVYSITLANTEQVVDLYVDGTVLINLTERGALDPVRQAKYGVTNWADLTEEQLENEIPYFDSVMSVNVEDGIANELAIENRGKNIYNWSEKLDGVTYVIEGHGKIGYILEDGSVVLQDYSSVKFKAQLKANTTYSMSFIASAGHINTTVKLMLGSTNIAKTDLYTINFSGLNSFSFVSDSSPDNCWLAFSTSIMPITITQIQLEEGSVATDYVPPRTDSITIPSAAEFHGFGGVFNEWSNNKFTKRISRESKITDSSGNLALSGYRSGTKIIVMNNDTGEVQVLDAAASVATGWNSQEVTVWYILSSASTIEVKASGGIYIYEGQNNVLSPNSKANLAMMLGVTTEGTEETRAFVRNFSVNSRVENIRFKPHFSRNVKTIPTSREYSISFDDPILDGSWDFKQHQDKRFTIKETVDNETESMEIKYHGCLVSELETSEDDVMVHRVSLVAETKEVS